MAQKKKTRKISVNTETLKKEDKKPQTTKQKSPSGLPTRVLVSNQSMYRVQSFKTTNFLSNQVGSIKSSFLGSPVIRCITISGDSCSNSFITISIYSSLVRI